MTKKRKQSYKKKSTSFSPKKTQKLNSQEGEILYQIYASQAPLRAKQIFAKCKKYSYEQLQNSLHTLVQKKIIHLVGGKTYVVSNKELFCTAILDANPRGFGFLHNMESNIEAQLPLQDPYVSQYNMSQALHGDKVLAYIFRTTQNGRSEAEIFHVIKRGLNRIAGVIAIDGSKGIVVPEDKRLPFVVQVTIPEDMSVRHGDGVIVTLKQTATPDKVRQGMLLESFGSPDSVKSQIRFVVEKSVLPDKFSGETYAELEQMGGEDHDPKRVDLRDIKFVTIDGDTAKDFDDAVCVEKRGVNFRLYVAIADVSHFVKVGSALDRDAYERGTSVYFPGTVIPMLPEKLSNNLCSLVPDEDRLTLTAILDIDRAGKLQKKSFCRSLIRSQHRFTYTRVQEILDTPGSVSADEKAFLSMLQEAEKLARILKEKRAIRGALGFTMPESIILLDSEGEVENVARSEAHFSQKIIEEFMLSANEAVAEFFTEQGCSALYRIHEKPDVDRVKEFATYAHNLGMQLPPPDNSPAWFGRVIEESKGSEKEFVVNNLLLRSMKQAKYSADNVGHFGLAATDYTHFTSPIRRYPDLMVHRELCRLVGYLPAETKNRSAQQAGDFLSGRERVATKAERELGDRLKCIFMERYIGETFKAIISGVTDTGFFVELKDFPISASAPIEELVEDMYLFDYRGHNLIGQNKGAFFSLGDSVEVTVQRIDRARNRVIVAPVQ
ncbi:ribonuclease R [Desulfotalea psychrophila]|uniref:Ribonuclease R n=1 Tax=Desulfotalea psychrophila (strain LSv54 / DSM 12343) TaxID=177439 RepID=Q6ALZ0_DESPS|nr:ribonuclease R [Desulfotalea psychrophila]CAG36635.1 related to ribonuclease R [Desulfotalea psychrophila LSv54]